MLRAKRWWRAAGAVVLVPLLLVEQSWAWGVDGHRMINQLAAANLPNDVPEFLRNRQAQEVMAYLGPEPDRWKSPAEPELGAAGSPEHYIDLEYADLVGELPHRRYDFIRGLAVAQKDHPDLPLSPEKVGLQPYAALEVWERLKAGMREYRALQADHEATRGAETAILFYAGWLGHYVGDGSMPLHTTIQFNGWTGPNPHGYTTEHTIHAQFESVFVGAQVKPEEVAPLVAASEPRVLGEMWPEYVAYLRRSNALVEKTYVLEKAGGFKDAGTPEGKRFAEERLAAGATELRDMIYTAWVRSADPVPEYKPDPAVPGGGAVKSAGAPAGVAPK